MDTLLDESQLKQKKRKKQTPAPPPPLSAHLPLLDLI